MTDTAPTNGWFQAHVVESLKRLEGSMAGQRQELADHREEFQRFKDQDFASMRERMARVEVRAGWIAALVGAVIAGAARWL